MRPSTPHYTSPADLRERLNQTRIQTGVKEWEGGMWCQIQDEVDRHNLLRGCMFAVIIEAVAVLAAFAIWHFWR